MQRLVIFANGSLPDIQSARRLLLPGDAFAAADGGTHHALALGVLPSIVIGDLDSLQIEDRQKLESQSVAFEHHPRNKDETDLELALLYGVKTGYRKMLIIGALGGRLDQTLGNLSLLTMPVLSGIDIRVDDGVEEAFFTRSQCELSGTAGDVVSLVPWGGETTGVFTEGLRWSLHDETLRPERTRGISNEMSAEIARISLRSGLLLVIHHRQGGTVQVR